MKNEKRGMAKMENNANSSLKATDSVTPHSSSN